MITTALVTPHAPQGPVVNPNLPARGPFYAGKSVADRRGYRGALRALSPIATRSQSLRRSAACPRLHPCPPVEAGSRAAAQRTRVAAHEAERETGAAGPTETQKAGGGEGGGKAARLAAAHGLSLGGLRLCTRNRLCELSFKNIGVVIPIAAPRLW